MYSIADKLGLKPNYNIESRVLVKDNNQIYYSAESIADNLGYPDAAVSTAKQLKGIKPINISNDTEGKIVAIGNHPNNSKIIIYVIETNDNKHFLISKDGLTPLDFN